MIAILFVVFFLVFLTALFQERLEKYTTTLYLALGVILILYAGLRPIGFDNDSDMYEYFYLNNNDNRLILLVEPSFMWLSRFFNSFTDDLHPLLMLYAIVGITLKMMAFRKLSDLLFLPLLIYIGKYYLLQDMTQIRAAVVTGLFLLSIVPLAEGRRRTAFCLLASAVVIHYSAIALFPALLFTNRDMTTRWRWIWASAIPAGALLFLTGTNLLVEIPIPYISDKIESYQNLRGQGLVSGEFNVFNLVYLTTCAIYLYLLYFYETIRPHVQCFPLMLRLMGCSVFLYSALALIPVVAIRLSQLYGAVEIILFACIFYTIRPAWMGKTLVGTIGFSLLLIQIFFNQLLHMP